MLLNEDGTILVREDWGVTPDGGNAAIKGNGNDCGGILGVTNRPAVRARIEAASARLSLPTPVFVDDISDAIELGIDRSVLLLDLGSCCRQGELLALVRVWAVFHPGSEIVLFTPLVEREAELRAALNLVAGLRTAVVRVLTASDFYREEAWQNLWRMRERAALQSAIRADLLAAINDIGRPLAAAPVVLGLLAEAGNGTEGGEQDEEVARSAAVRRLRARERKMVWQRLRQSGQLPSSWLLVIFRLLWYAKLREEGWPSSRIAEFLGFRSPRHFRLKVSRRLGAGLKALRVVSYEDSLRWAAELLTAPNRASDVYSVRSLMQPLMQRGELRPP